MIISVLWIIFGFIFGFGSACIILSKRIKKLNNIIKSQSDGFVKNYNLFFQTVSKKYGDENNFLQSQIKLLTFENLSLKKNLVNLYTSEQFIKINRKLKKYKKKIKKMHKIMPYYSIVVNFFTFLKDKF